MAATAASAPLLPPFTPARSSACSMVSQVSTPKPTAHSASIDTCPTPFDTSLATYSKCGVPPRITAPSATAASKRLLRATRRITAGISKVPGHR